MRWPIRVKLILGLILVVGMMLTLLGGAILGLQSSRETYFRLANRLRELGAAKDLFERVIRLDVVRLGVPEVNDEARRRAEEARSALTGYFEELRKNALHGATLDAAGIAFEADYELTAILAALQPEEAVKPALNGTLKYITDRPALMRAHSEADLEMRIVRLNHTVMQLPDKLHRDFYDVLLDSKAHYEASSFIVWVTAPIVLGLLVGVTVMLYRWIVLPIRRLEQGVRRVARGSFDERITLDTGDELEALADGFNDMTARLKEMYGDLERQVEERSKQLVRSERLAGVGFLAAGVAHEINNPLASIAFCSEALENRLRPALEKASAADAKVIQQYLRMVQEEAFRCKSITEKLLDFSRCGDIQRERTELGGLIQGVVDMIRHIGKYRGKQITFQPRGAILAHVDPQEIKQVVLNLVVNALESMEQGGVLRIDLRCIEGKAEMVFADDGCGIAPELLETIFEPFFTKRKGGKGTGLGLSITNRIVSRHHGEITAASAGEGKGATFVVRLPIQDPPPEQASGSKSNRAA
ncbi:MAG: ATP-binding protein [Isosphaeraceae bacterium]|nr:ATP-binding protein [Isosphaeraceae bacterium]